MDFDQQEPGGIPGQGSGEGALTQLLWHAASFILPVFSLRFYRIVQRKRISRALVFFVLFGTVLSVLFTFKIVRIIDELDREIAAALAGGDFPDIVIQDGVASVDAPQPLVLLDQEGRLFVLDTSGVYEDIERERYREGILLTRTDLIVLDGSGERSSIRLAELNDLFNTDPIVIDETFVQTAWERSSRVAIVVGALALWIWHTVLRLMVLALLGLLIWRTVSVVRSQMDFASIMVTGIYAAVPALYLHYLLGRVGLTVPGLQTMILMLIWLGISMASLGYGENSFVGQEGSLLRMTPVGIPMLLVLGWDVVFAPDIEPLALWGVPVLTFIAWMVMRRFHYEEDQPPAGLE